MKNELTRRRFKAGIATVLLVCFILCTPSISLGWGAGGHMMTAQIAFSRMNRKAKAKAKALLAIEIDPVDATTKSKDFVNASHWPDDLRDFPEFNSFLKRHFINNPFVTDGTAPTEVLPDPDNIVKALEDNVNILKTSTDENAQAQALRFIIHFVGDIHQPLHCATRVDSAHTGGDLGGNKVSIKVPLANGQVKTTNLHSYWDGGIGDFPLTRPGFKPPPLSEIPPAVAKAKRGNPATDPDLKLDDPFNFSAWADESFALATDVAYVGMTDGVTPSAAYNRKAKKVARKRVAWGGYRLAALLNAIWPK